MSLKLLNVLALAGLLIALGLNWTWPWGVLFLYWTWPALVAGQTELIGPVSRDEEPVLFWMVVILWVLLGALMILADLAPEAVTNFYASVWRLT